MREREEGKTMPKKERRRSAKKSPKETEAPWLPDKDSILEVETFTSPKGKRYRVLKTDLTDPYDMVDEPNEPAGRDV
jgi:hypothetical protein